MWSQALLLQSLYQSPSTLHSLAVSQHTVLLESQTPHLSADSFLLPPTRVSCAPSHLLGPAHSRINICSMNY